MIYHRRAVLGLGAAAGLLALPGCSSLPGLSLTELADGSLAPMLRFDRHAGAVSAVITMDISNDLETWTPLASSSAGGPVIALHPDVTVFDAAGEGGSVLSLDTGWATAHFRYRVEER